MSFKEYVNSIRGKSEPVSTPRSSFADYVNNIKFQQAQEQAEDLWHQATTIQPDPMNFPNYKSQLRSGNLPKFQPVAVGNVGADGVLSANQQQYDAIMKQRKDTTDSMYVSKAAMTYDEVQAEKNKYAPGTADYEKWDKFSDYRNLEDFDKALADANNHWYKTAEKAYNDWSIPTVGQLNKKATNENGVPTYYTQQDVDAAIKARDDYMRKILGGKSWEEIRDVYDASWIKELETKRNRWELDHAFDKYKNLFSNDDFAGLSQYNPTTKNGSDRDDIYKFINNANGTARLDLQAQHDKLQANAPVYMPSEYAEMFLEELTEDEIKVYNYLYATSGKTAANEFLAYMQPTLGKRASDDMTRMVRKTVDDSTIASAVLSAASVPLSVGGGLYAMASGGNPYSIYSSISNLSSDIRKEVGENIAESTEGMEIFGQNIPAFLYNTAMSVGDSALGAVSFGKAFTPIMGTNAYQQTAKELTEAGENKETVVASALASGIAEAVFEYASIDNLLKIKDVSGIKNAITNALKQSAIEGTEETFTEISNILTDTIFRGDTSEISQLYNQLKAQGLSESEINIEIAKHIGGKIGWAFAGGALSGGVTGSGASVTSLLATQKYASAGKIIRDHFGEDINGFLEYALNSPKKDTRQFAEGITNKNLTNRQLGILYNFVVDDVTSAFATANTVESVSDTMKKFDDAPAAVKVVAFSAQINRMAQLVKDMPEEQQAAFGGSMFTPLSAANGEKDAVTKSVEKVTGHMELTADQKELRRIGSQFGAKVKFADLDRYITDKNGKRVLDSPNGRFDPNTNTITLNTSNKVKHDPVEFILKHEMTHSFEINKEAYAIFSNEVLQSDVFKDYVKNQKGFDSVDAWSKNIIDRYDKAGHPLGEDGTEKALGAQHEMIADFVGDMLFGGKTKITEDLMNAMSPKARRSFIEWVKDFWAELKRIFAGKSELVTIEQLEKDFLELARKVEKQNAKKNAKAEQSVSKRNQNAAVNEKTTTDEGGGVEYSATNNVVIDLSNDNELSRRVEGLNKNKRYAAIKEYILSELSEQPITLSDGRQAVVDRGDAQHLSKKAGQRKTVHIAKIKQIVETAQLVAEEESDKEGKFDYFYYYQVDVRYDGDIYPIYLNVGKAHNDGTYHIYDITKKLRDTVHRVNDVGQPVGNALVNGISKNSIPDSAESVKENVEKVNVGIDEKTESASPLSYSLTSWEQSDYVDNRNTAAKELADALGITQKKAKDYIDSINSIAKVIADDRTRLDYVAAKGRSTFVSNAEYGGSVDCSTLCPKRKILTGTFSAIQKALKNSALTAEEILDIRNRMKEKGLEVSCGLCYVEGSRAQMGKFSKEFIERYKKTNPEYVPDMFDVNTPEGVEQLRIDHPEAYEAYEKFWNNKGVLNEGDSVLFASQQKPKLYQTRTDYKGEILNKFKSEGNVVEKNKNGGLRLQSFSDFEIVHLIDMMQVVMDMSRVGLAGQAYTKVPDFALALGNTGLKINLSLIAKGVDADGNLIFDDVEGMPIDTAMRIRDMYSDNVGTILVVFNDAQLKAALADNRVDFIIPFHRSQWKKALYEKLGLPKGTKDYTYQQNEKYIKPVYYTTRNGTIGKRKATNYMPNEYWDFGKSGKENAEAYLKMCAENNKRPKFYKLLVDNKDGSYSLQPDGSTDGYWKLLIDFKMYNNDGVGVPQQPVKPDFNMVESIRMLEEYKGGHQQFPVDQETVDEFVKDYKAKHKMDDFVENEVTEAKAPDNPYSNFSYSLPETDLDAEYMSSVESGDIEKAEFLMLEAAKRAGYTVEVYHGTNEYGYTKIDVSYSDDGRTFFVTDSEKLAKTYMDENMSTRGMYRLLLNESDFVEIDCKGKNWNNISKDLVNEALKEWDVTWRPPMEWENLGRLNTREVAHIIKYHSPTGGVKFKNLRDAGYFYYNVPHTVYACFYPEIQLKSAEVITYDDQGNVIPLSQRFNAENEDIRYSLPESVDFDSLIDSVSRGEMSAEEAKRLSKSNKLLNPIEIANTPKSEASTTPKLDEPKMQGEGDGESKLHGSLDRSAIITDEVKEKIKADTYIKNYGTTTNKETLAKAMQRLDEGGAKEVYWWEKTLKPDEANAVNVAEGLILLQRYQDAGDTYGAIAVAEKLREIASASGQTVQIFSVIGRFTPEMMVAYSQHELDTAFEIMQEGRTKAWVEANAEKFQLTEEEKQAIYDKTLLASSLEDGSRVKAILLGEITTMLQNKLPPEKGQALRAWMRISLLFNAKTQFRNILGNASMILPYISSDFFGGLIDAAIAKKTGVRTTGFNAKTFGKSLVQGGKKGALETIDDYKRRIHTKAEELNRFETNAGSGKSFNENHQKLVALNKISKVLNEVDRLNSMFLEMGDRPFFEAWFMNSLENQMRLNKVSEPTLQMVEMAKQEALQRTWQDDNNITKAMSGIKNKLNEVTPGYKHTGYGIGDVVLKFVKTPSNIFKAMIELSPVGFGSAAFKIRDMKVAMDKGEFTPAMQKEVVRSLSNAITGTAIYLLVYALAASGAIDFSGGGDEDKDVSNFEKYILGIPPYSFKFLGMDVTYTWNQPIGTVLAVVSDIMEDAEDGDINGWDAISTVGTVFTSQSFLSNLYEVFSKDDFLTGLASAAFSEPSAAIPTLLSQMASVTDPYRRTSYDPSHPIQSALKDIIYRVPFLRTTLPKQVNVLGQDAKNPQFANIYKAFISPSTHYPKADMSVMDVSTEVYALYQATSDKTVMPRVAPNKVTIGGKEVTFSVDEKADFQRRTGELSVEILREMFALPEYDKLTDEEKTEAVSKVYNYVSDKAKSELDIYDYETLSAMEGTRTNGEPVLKRSTYDRMDDKAKQMLVDDYFFSKDERNCKGDPKKLAKLFVKKAKD